MSDTGSSSGEGAASQAVKERVRRIRRIILIGTAVACAAGAISTSFSPPKTVSAPVAGAQPDGAAPAPSDPATGAPGPAPAPEKPAADDDAERTPARAGAVPVTDPADAAHAGLPALALEAYQRAADEQAIRTPGCHLPWTLLAAIGQVESHHARNGALTSEGFTTSRILGPVLNGGLFAALPDSDRGTYDGDTTWDRAVGPMQFIPSTWKRWGTTTRPTLDADPNNIFDATTTAAAYLCADNRDLNDPQQLNRAILSYNPSETYVRDVLAWNAAYASGHSVVALPEPMAVPAIDSSGSGSGELGGGLPSPPAAAGQVVSAVSASLPRDTGPSGSASRPAGDSKGTQPPRSTPASASASASGSASAPAPSAGGGASASPSASAGASAAQPPTAVGQAVPHQQLPPSQSGVPTQSAPPSDTPAASPQPSGTKPPASEPSPGAPHKPAPQSPSLLTRATTQIGGLLHNLGERVLG